jgi:hypothetical protein
VCFHSCPPPYLGIKKSESRDGQKRRREKKKREREEADESSPLYLLRSLLQYFKKVNQGIDRREGKRGKRKKKM